MTSTIARWHRFMATGVMALPLAMAGCSGCDTSSIDQPPPAVGPQSEPTLSEVDVNVGAKGFMPCDVHWTRGAPLSLVFKRTRDDACGSEVSIPDLNIVRALPLNEPVTVTIPATTAGKYDLKCGSSAFVGHVYVL
jgi:plastocyanin domain-containing protein